MRLRLSEKASLKEVGRVSKGNWNIDGEKLWVFIKGRKSDGSKKQKSAWCVFRVWYGSS